MELSFSSVLVTTPALPLSSVLSRPMLPVMQEKTLHMIQTSTGASDALHQALIINSLLINLYIYSFILYLFSKYLFNPCFPFSVCCNSLPMVVENSSTSGTGKSTKASLGAATQGANTSSMLKEQVNNTGSLKYFGQSIFIIPLKLEQEA